MGPASERAQKPKVAKEPRTSRGSKPAQGQPQPLMLSESFCTELATSKSFCAEISLMPSLSRPCSFGAFPGTPTSLYTYLSPVVCSPTSTKALGKGLSGSSAHDTYGSPLGCPPAANGSAEQPAALMLSESFFQALDHKGPECSTPNTFHSPLGCTPTSAQALEKDLSALEKGLWGSASAAAPASASAAVPMAHRQVTSDKSLGPVDGMNTAPSAQRRKKLS